MNILQDQNIQNIIIIILLVVVSILLCVTIYCTNNNVEGFDGDEALQNVASLYNSEDFKITNLEVTGKIDPNTIRKIVPKGVILAWSGKTPPEGWALCDGKNGTPDLRGRFIRMYSDDMPKPYASWGKNKENVFQRPINLKGGFDSDIAGNSRSDKNSWIGKFKIGDYAGTDHMVMSVNEMPRHTHKYKGFWGNYKVNDTSDGNEPTDDPHYFASRSTEAAGSGNGHNNMPPFYVLAYIMKV